MTKDEEKKMFEEYVKNHPELKKIMNKMKYDALISLFDNDELWGNDISKKNSIIRYFTIFRDADVDADVVLQATMALMDQPTETPEVAANMSEAELTAFVNTLNKIRKQGEDKDE